MKKLICLIVATFFINNIINSQITKGNWLMGGNLHFANSNTSGTASANSKVTEFNLSPIVGVFVIHKTAIGLRSNLASVRDKYESTPGNLITNKQSKFGIGPFVRYYFLSDEHRINILSELNLVFNQVFIKPYNGSTSKSNNTEYTFQSGAVVFLNTSIAIEALIGYSFFKEKQQDFNAKRLTFNIGFQIHLEKN